jgi:hypothetical protein
MPPSGGAGAPQQAQPQAPFWREVEGAGLSRA